MEIYDGPQIPGLTPRPAYVPPDASDQVVWGLSEASLPCANVGALGAAANLKNTNGSYLLGRPPGKWPAAGAAAQFMTAGRIYTDNGVAQIDFPISISLWWCPTSWGPDEWGQIVARVYYVGGTDVSPWTSFTVGHYSTSYNGDWYIGFTLTGGGSADVRPIGGVDRLQLNVWQHIGCTYDGANIIVYRNGAPIRTLARTGGPNIDYTNAADWRVGQGSLRRVSGYLADVRIANVVRTASWWQRVAGLV